ncbi:MAG: nucleotide exchange factor GrpE [Rikenellaceae bacterium]|nr:nucleotide exchange factor GrpE [Rikenellaceae bacterium]
MTKHKEKEQVTDKENVKDCKTESGAQQCETPGTADTDIVADESFEAGDNSAEMSGAAREWQDKYLRLSAEFDNYRKRTLREKMDLIATGGEDVIKSILGVMDDIDRAIIAMDAASDTEALKQGVVLIHQKLMETLRAKGLSEIEAIGLELDTDLHEAVAQIPVDEARKGKIVDVVQKGYKLKDKVVRYAKVVVGE